MNIAICDDNKFFCEHLKKELLNKLHTRINEIVIVDIFTNSEEFNVKIIDGNYQIVFLDIDMPKINGFYLADRISVLNPNCLVVFVTNHDYLVFDAIKKHPFAFVRKSKISIELEQTIDDLILAQSYLKKYYLIKRYNDYIRLPLYDIQYIEAKGNNVLFHLEDNVFQKKAKLSEVERELPSEQFIRTGKSYIVNLCSVYGAITTTGITLKNGKHIPVSRNKISIVKNAYSAFLRGGI